jgi:chemotaxis protein CheD
LSNPAEAEIVSVPIGRWQVTSAPRQIRTLLGSCAGVVLHDRAAKLGGVAHIVLPDSKGATDQPGKFANTAIPAMIADLDRLLGRSTRGRLTAKVVGGASMFQTGPTLNIGKMNQDAVDQILNDLRIPVLARDVGGVAGRRLTLDLATGIVKIRVPGGEDYVI